MNETSTRAPPAPSRQSRRRRHGQPSTTLEPTPNFDRARDVGRAARSPEGSHGQQELTGRWQARQRGTKRSPTRMPAQRTRGSRVPCSAGRVITEKGSARLARAGKESSSQPGAARARRKIEHSASRGERGDQDVHHAAAQRTRIASPLSLSLEIATRLGSSRDPRDRSPPRDLHSADNGLASASKKDPRISPTARGRAVRASRTRRSSPFSPRRCRPGRYRSDQGDVGSASTPEDIAHLVVMHKRIPHLWRLRIGGRIQDFGTAPERFGEARQISFGLTPVSSAATLRCTDERRRARGGVPTKSGTAPTFRPMPSATTSPSLSCRLRNQRSPSH